jgi:hypothetical protein
VQSEVIGSKPLSACITYQLKKKKKKKIICNIMKEITEKSNHHQVIKAFEATFPHIRSMMLCKRDNGLYFKNHTKHNINPGKIKIKIEMQYEHNNWNDSFHI